MSSQIGGGDGWQYKFTKPGLHVGHNGKSPEEIFNGRVRGLDNWLSTKQLEQLDLDAEISNILLQFDHIPENALEAISRLTLTNNEIKRELESRISAIIEEESSS